MSLEIKIVDVDEDVVEATPDVAPHKANITKEFLLAGHAYFSVINPKGTRFEFVIKGRAGKAGTQWAGKISYYLRVHARGTYQYVGVVSEDDGGIIPTGRSEYLKGTLEFDVAQWALTTVFNGSVISAGYTITHKDKCGKCARMLAERGDRETGFHLDCTP